MEEEIYLNTKEAAEFLEYSINTLNCSRSTGILAGKKAPSFQKLGKRRVRYKKSELSKWKMDNTEIM